MGPNVPLTEGGQVVGFFSPRAPKHYTGGACNTTGPHPGSLLGQAHGWRTGGPMWWIAFAGYVEVSGNDHH